MEKDKDKKGMTESTESAAAVAGTVTDKQAKTAAADKAANGSKLSEMFAAFGMDTTDEGADELPFEPEQEHKEIKLPFLRVFREQFRGRDNGQKYWGYFVAGKVLGQPARATIKAANKRAYDLLEMLFKTCGGLALRGVPYSIRDEVTGQVRHGFGYEICVRDEDGEIFSVKVSPSQSSDKAVLDYLYQKAIKEVNAV